MLKREDGVVVFDDGDPCQGSCCSNPHTISPEHDCDDDDSCFELHYMVECLTCGSFWRCQV